MRAPLRLAACLPILRGCIALACALPSLRAAGAGVWHPGTPGSLMTEHTHNVGDAHRSARWMTHAGCSLSVDDAAVYDTWRTTDQAPQIRIDLGPSGIGVRDANFTLTAQVRLQTGYGTAFQAGLCITLEGSRHFAWGPHGSTNLRFRREDGVNVSVAYTGTSVYLKLKRRKTASGGDCYSAWYSADGEMWTKAGEETLSGADAPLYAGVMLKTWGSPHGEYAVFHYLDITHVRDAPGPLTANRQYGRNNATAPYFVYSLSGIEILLRMFQRDSPSSSLNPGNVKLYIIHATERAAGSDEYEALGIFDALFNDLTDPAGTNNFHKQNLVAVLPRFLRGPHPYPGRAGFAYQFLRAEEDRILIDLHEDWVREEFPASAYPASVGADDRFFLVGHSGGGQFVSRFVMAHAAKVFRAAASAPSSCAFPNDEVEWPDGTLLPAQFAADNPRFACDLDALRDLPLMMLMGENDNLVYRGEIGDRYEMTTLAYSRHDNARKWVRQMDRAMGGMPNLSLYCFPELGHPFSSSSAGAKRTAALDFLFGTAAERASHDALQYTYRTSAADSVAVGSVDTNTLRYFQFAMFTPPCGWTTQRCEFVFSTMLCFVYDEDGKWLRTVPFSFDDGPGGPDLTLEGVTYTAVERQYGRITLKDAANSHRLEQTQCVTLPFIVEQLVGRDLHLFYCTGRERWGPAADPEPGLTIRLNLDYSVTDVGTGAAPSETRLRRWKHYAPHRLLYFTDSADTATNTLCFGEWRWGEDTEGDPYVAGLSTRDQAGIRRVQLQSRPVYNPRLFEDWSEREDYDGDAVANLVDNCPVIANPGQEDIDRDGIGDIWDDNLEPPFLARASGGLFPGGVQVTWAAAASGMLYRVYRSVESDADSGSAYELIADWLSGTSFVDTAASPGALYSYCVESSDRPAEKVSSAQCIPFSGWAPLGQPTGVAASDGLYAGFVGVRWSATAGARYYRVSRREGTGSYAPVSQWISERQFLDAKAEVGVTYQYAVRAAADSAGTRSGALSAGDSGWRKSGTDAYDFGDAPDTAPRQFATRLAANGARHVILPGLRLGAATDSETNGFSSALANGDDSVGQPDDEDGVTFPAEWAAGGWAVLGVAPAASGYANVWVDQDASGAWDTNEHVVSDAWVSPGTNYLSFLLPADAAVETGLFVRVRFCTIPGLSCTGLALNGEVEDYLSPKTVSAGELSGRLLDYGDAPAPYPVTRRDDGACHETSLTGVCLGSTVDEEADGRPSSGASGDDASGSDDENGVVLASGYLRGKEHALTVSSKTGGYLSGWVDFNADGDWDDDGERVWSALSIDGGANAVTLAVPSGAIPGRTFMRLRICSFPVALGPRGFAPDGEVEDYALTILQSVDVAHPPLIEGLRVDQNAAVPYVELFWSGPAGTMGTIQEADLLGAGQIAWRTVDGPVPADWWRGALAATGAVYRVVVPSSFP